MEPLNREVVTRLEVEPGRSAASRPLSKRLTSMLLDAQQIEPERTKSEALELSPAELIEHATADPLLRGLMDRLPKPDTVWSLDDRGKWLRAAAVIFTLIYKLDESDSRAFKALP
jgi:hypothetical protein